MKLLDRTYIVIRYKYCNGKCSRRFHFLHFRSMPVLERATGLDRSLYRLPVLMLDDFSQITPELIRQVRKHYATRKGLIEREREREREREIGSQIGRKKGGKLGWRSWKKAGRIFFGKELNWILINLFILNFNSCTFIDSFQLLILKISPYPIFLLHYWFIPPPSFLLSSYQRPMQRRCIMLRRVFGTIGE